MFPKIGVITLKSSILNRVFHYFHHPFLDTPSFGNTQIVQLLSQIDLTSSGRDMAVEVLLPMMQDEALVVMTRHDSVLWDRWKLGSLGWDQWVFLTPIYPIYDQIGEFFSTIPRKPNPRGSMYGIYLGGGFKYFLFSPLFGEDSHVD